MKRTKQLLLVLLMAICLPQGAWALGGSGTSSSPYTIANAADLVAFADKVNNQNESTACGQLTADIDLSGITTWTPIGSSTAKFMGIFDGNGHSITGMSILNYTTDYQGLFAWVEGTADNNRAVLKNFSLSGTMTSSTANLDYIGGVVGRCADYTDLIDVTNRVNITITAGIAQNHMGGVAGWCKGTRMTRCVNYGNIDAGATSNCVAGVMGYATTASSLTNCVNYGSISSTADNAYIAGILGYINNANFAGAHNCLNTGTITGGSANTYAGAIYGWYRQDAAIKSTNNYYLSTSAAKGYGANNALTDNLDNIITSKTAAQLASGEVCELLGQHTFDGDDHSVCTICNHGFFYYTSTDNATVNPFFSSNLLGADGLKANIISNTNVDGQGVIEFAKPLVTIGKQAFEGSYALTSIVIPSSVVTIGENAFQNCSGLTGDLIIPNSVTSIGHYAFNGCSGFQGTLTLPENLETIGNYAFYHCSFTGNLVIPNPVSSIGDNAFYNCSGFTGNLTLGNSLETIGERAFNSCSGFTGNLTIGSSVTSIGDQAFYNCSGFNGNLTLGNSLETIGSEAFRGCVFNGNLVIPNSVTSIGTRAFHNCSGFTGNLTIGSSVTSIGDETFYECSGFTGNLTLGNSLETIGSNAFRGCVFNGNLVIPNSVTSIGNNAFYNCSGFNGNLTIGSSVETIGTAAFRGCSSFTGNLVIPNSVTSIGDQAFYNCSGFNGNLTISNAITIIGNHVFYNCSKLEGNLVIPNSVTAIGNYAFNGCSGFQGTLTLPENLETIGENAFRNCSGLTGDLIIPNSVTSLGQYSFYNCYGFTGNLVIPSSVTTIGNYAFQNCSGFNGTLTLPNALSSINTSVFQDCSGFTGNLTIPASVTSIGRNSFSGCLGFTSVEIQSVPRVYANAFLNVTPNKAFALSDNSYVYVNYSNDIPSSTPATYTRQMSAASLWGTVVLPFDAVSNEDVQLYELTAVTNEAMTFSPVDNVNAETPCVFKKKDESATSVTFTGNNVSVYIPATPSVAVGSTGWTMNGTYTNLTEQTGMYFIAQNAFWLAEAPITIAPFRAWFEGNIAGAPTRLDIVENTEIATSLDAIHANANATKVMIDGQICILKNGQTFDMSGRKMK